MDTVCSALKSAISVASRDFRFVLLTYTLNKAKGTLLAYREQHMSLLYQACCILVLKDKWQLAKTTYLPAGISSAT